VAGSSGRYHTSRAYDFCPDSGSDRYLARDDAREQAAIATSRSLAVEADARLDHGLDTGQLLAAAAFRTDRSAITEAALFRSAYSSPYLRRFLRENTTISALALSADGTALYIGDSLGGVARVNPDTGERLQLPSLPRLVNALVLSNDGTKLAAGTDQGDIMLVDLKTLVHTTLSALGNGPIYALAISQDNQLIAAGDDKRIGLYSLQRSARIAEHELDELVGISGLFFEAPGTLIANYGEQGGEQFTVPNLRPVPGKSGPNLEGTIGYTRSGNRVAAVLGDTVAALPTIGRGAAIQFPKAPGLSDATDLAVSEDARRVAIADHQRIIILDASGERRRPRVSAPLTGTAGANLLAIDANGDRLISVRATIIAVWDLANLPPTVHQLEKVPADITGPAADLITGAAVFAYYDNGVMLWDLKAAKPLTKLPNSAAPNRRPESEWIDYVAASKDLTHAAVPTMGGFAVYAITDGTARQVQTIRIDEDAFTQLRFNGDQVITMSEWNDKDLILVQRFDMASGTQLSQFQTKRSRLPNLSELSADGTTIIGPREDGSILFLSTNDNQPIIAEGKRPDNRYDELANWVISGDGKTAAVERMSGHIDVWDLQNKKLVNQFELGQFQNVWLSTDGSRLAAENQQSIQLWPTSSRSAQGRISVTSLPQLPNTDQLPQVEVVAFAPDLRSLYGILNDGRIVSWTLEPNGLLDVVCNRAGRNLAAEEWTQLTGTRAPADLECRGR
jgi:WD40 repeat protein